MKRSDKARLTGFTLLVIGIGLVFIPQTNSISFFVIGFSLAEIGNAHRYEKEELKYNDNNSPKKK